MRSFSASSSGIETPKFFSSSIINSTLSSESAPRSLVKDALFVTAFKLTPSLSTTSFLIRSAISDSVEIVSLARELAKELEVAASFCLDLTPFRAETALSACHISLLFSILCLVKRYLVSVPKY